MQKPIFSNEDFWSGITASLQCKLSEIVLAIANRASPSLDMSLLKIKDDSEDV